MFKSPSSPIMGKPIPARPAAFTLIELLVVIAIIAILAAILFPVFAQARAKARQTVCLSNTKQIGNALMMYSQDFDETLPMGGWQAAINGVNCQSRWFRDLYPYVKSLDVYVCPEIVDDPMPPTPGFYRPTLNSTAFPRFPGDTTPYPTSAGGYAMNANLVSFNAPGRSLAEIKNPAGTFFVCDASRVTSAVMGNTDATTWPKFQDRNSDWEVYPPTDWTGSAGSYTRYSTDNTTLRRRPMARHNGGLSILYCDGHAKWSHIKQFLGPLTTTPPGWPYGDPNNTWDNQ